MKFLHSCRLEDGGDYMVRVFAQNEAGLSRDFAELSEAARASVPIGACRLLLLISNYLVLLLSS